MTTSEAQLEEFLSYLGQSLVRISNLCDSTHDGQCRSFKKALLFAFIDNLSTLAYPERKSNKKSIKKLVTEYGHWQDADLVSTPHLCRWIEVQPGGLTDKGVELAWRTLAKWEHGCIVPISHDMQIEAIKRHVRPGEIKAANDISRFTHFSLLWNQRHHLIHRFMPIGVNLEFADDDYPYYIGLSSLEAVVGNSKSTALWQLVYPTGFLFNLAQDCLAGVASALRERPLDVKRHYRVGLYLQEDLNWIA